MKSENKVQKVPGRWREVALFLFCSLSCMSFVFRSALWDGSLLAPLDIAPALYSKFHWVDQTQGPIPQNHYTVDIFDHELPRQYNIYRAIHSGEFPWWDPYTDCGRPLVAEGHISGTDALRLALYRFLSFVGAYNLTKLLHSLMLGLGTFLLLRQFGRSRWVSIAGALSCQFAGSYALFQTPLSVSASATWYPWIWLVWSIYMTSKRLLWIILGGGFVGLSVVAGNQQTHAFLALFAGCFLAGQWWVDRNSCRSALKATLISCLLGVLLTLPVLAPQVELYLLCERRPALADFSRIQILTGAASLTGLFPWILGTFRTLDVSKLFGQGSLGFCLFIGCAAFILSAVQAAGVFRKSRRTAECSVSFLVLLAYFAITSTPLVAVFYTRVASLATLGLIVLASGAAEDLLESKLSDGQRRLAMIMTIGLVVMFLGCNLFSFFVYPRVRDRIESAFLKKQEANRSFGVAVELRRYQVQNLSREISVLNPATVWGLLSVLALAPAMFSTGRKRANWLAVALVLNLLPELEFAERFTVKSPVALWECLLKGGPEQQRVLEALQGESRLGEEAPGRFDFLFPGATPDLYRVHSVRGYSSFGLPDLSARLHVDLPNAASDDFRYASATSGSPVGKLNRVSGAGTARFEWEDGSDREIRIVSETLNTVTVAIGRGAPGVLWRTDRYYPGWKLISPSLETHVVDSAFLVIKVPAGEQTLVFRYSPEHLPSSLAISLLVALACAAFLFVNYRSGRKARDIAQN